MCINCYNVYGQFIPVVDKWIEYMENLVEETEDEERAEALYDELSYLLEHPFNINTVSGEELKQLPFLSDYQIESILTYRERYGAMVSLYELKNIDELDYYTLSLLLPFVYPGEDHVNKLLFSVENLLKQGRNNLKMRYNQCFQQKQGYQHQPDSILERYPNRKYLGEPFYHSLSYSYKYDKYIHTGIVAEKDVGEPFWNRHHKGYDFYSVHLFVKNRKKLKSLAIGDYKVSFGQGLVVSNDFKPTRSMNFTQTGNKRGGFKRHFSTDETNFFRGAAATVTLGKWDYSLFYSYRKLDASVDSSRFSSVKTDGLHRLPRDREKKGTVPMQTFGGNINYFSTDFSIGITTVSCSFGRLDMQPEPKPYNLYHFRGNQNWNVSVNYSFLKQYFNLYGETAISKNGALATINNLQLTPAYYVLVMLSHRYYDKKYQSYFGNAFSQNSAVQNEEGVYLGIQFSPFGDWKMSGYVDIYRFPWMKYGVDAPSSGKEYMGEIAYYTYDRELSFYVRYKCRQKEKNVRPAGDNLVSILPYNQHRLRIQGTYPVTPFFVFRSSAEGTMYEEQGKRSTGFIFSQSVAWKPVSIPLQKDIYAAFFYTDDYNTRVNSYEKKLSHSFSMPSFYGKGFRMVATVKWNIYKKLAFSATFTYTRYLDRDTIGTGLEMIEGKHKTDLYTAVNWKF